MKLLATIGISVCLMATAPGPASAQYLNPDWIEVAPEGDSFHISMPNQVRAWNVTAGAFSGKRYATTIGVASYTVWSLADPNYRPPKDRDEYLDSCAELVWEGLLKPARDALDDKAQALAHMGYVRELPADAPMVVPSVMPGREYSLTIGDVTGTTEFFVANEHLYVMLAMGKPGQDWPREKFFSSFKTSLALATPSPMFGDPRRGVSTPGADDYNRVFTGKEVTSKVRIHEKPEPTYSESARKFGVQGTIILRAVFSKDGEVTNVHVVSKLPHGLTLHAVAAARSIRFDPATKDGHFVSMWMELQYNFHLY